MVRKIANGMSGFFGRFPVSIFENNTCIFVPNMANTCVFDTKEGLVIFDLPIRQSAKKTFDKIRNITNKAVGPDDNQTTAGSNSCIIIIY